jgi:peptidoglycan/xylan/chitin deacetylase (PgdA/CDA1 family)
VPPTPGSLPVTPPPIDPRSRATVIEKCITPGMFALTYDDGPSTNIPALLLKLDQLKVKATFFINAQNFANFVNPASQDAQLVKAIFDQGHQIGTHTFSHKDLATLDIQGIWDEMRLNDDAIKRIIGKRPTHLRPPFLSTSPRMLEAVGSFGYKVVSINLDTKDFEHNNKPNEVALQHQTVDAAVLQSNIARDSFISLNHDFTSKIVQWTEEFVALARGKGYKLVTTAECIGDQNPYQD